MYKIGYVDEAEKEVKKIIRKLENDFEMVSYDIQRGLPKDELINRIYQSDIDLLLVDYFLKDKGTLVYNGDTVVREFEKIKPKFPMIIFTNEPTDAFPQVDNVNIIYSKEVLDKSKPWFIEVLKRNIQYYHQYIDSRKKRIAELIEIRQLEELTPIEKEELFNLQLDLNKLDERQHKETPNHLLSDKNLDELTEITEDAEKLLMSLLKQKNDPA
ncbi:hypothetical protein ACSBL2_00365 [Pedobacter sp. AW31-3R]|uniref:hypothetical protein n=1 Tax=Pedobacter sp. AW31-3R TaxID=3445781 RepID=UPI003F9FF32A